MGQARAGSRSPGRPPKAPTGRSSTSVVLDGRVAAELPARASSRYGSSRSFATGGNHEVQVLATDIFGQSTLTPSKLPLEDRRPSDGADRAGSRLAHERKGRLSDQGSGLVLGSVQRQLRRRRTARAAGAVFVHRYAHAGTYTVLSVAASDGLGNSHDRAAQGERPMRLPAIMARPRARSPRADPRGRSWRSLSGAGGARRRLRSRSLLSASACADRPKTRTTPRSPKTGATSSSTARSAASRVSGGATPTDGGCAPLEQVRRRRRRAAVGQRRRPLRELHDERRARASPRSPTG